uniref:Uncharacterized protein n=1 Tax=Romanomermis culicivorax TaxID=13658 RepID=A0A915K653_ROMCU
MKVLACLLASLAPLSALKLGNWTKDAIPQITAGAKPESSFKQTKPAVGEKVSLDIFNASKLIVLQNLIRFSLDRQQCKERQAELVKGEALTPRYKLFSIKSATRTKQADHSSEIQAVFYVVRRGPCIVLTTSVDERLAANPWQKPPQLIPVFMKQANFPTKDKETVSPPLASGKPQEAAVPEKRLKRAVPVAVGASSNFTAPPISFESIVTARVQQENELHIHKSNFSIYLSISAPANPSVLSLRAVTSTEGRFKGNEAHCGFSRKASAGKCYGKFLDDPAAGKFKVLDFVCVHLNLPKQNEKGEENRAHAHKQHSSPVTGGITGAAPKAPDAAAATPVKA